MFKKISFLVLGSLLTGIISVNFSGVPVEKNTAYGEGVISTLARDFCDIRITGVIDEENSNAGETTFNAHPGPDPEFDGKPASLAIVGITDKLGFAPGMRADAACAAEESGDYAGESYKYSLKGYSWNTNLGFISYNCKTKENKASRGAGVSCGDYDYGVYIGKDNKLRGYAWNASFGWIKFSDNLSPDYDVKVNPADGTVTGYAWTQAGIWMKMAGIKIHLPGAVVVDDGNWCDGKNWLCVEVKPNPRGLSLRLDASGQITGNVPIGDGDRDRDNGYDVYLYLKDESGDPLDSGVYNVDDFLKSIELVWEDTVKADGTGSLTDEEKSDLAIARNPWGEKGGKGAIVHKPLTFADFDSGVEGVYKSEQRIRSWAPTSESNISYTVSTNPRYQFLNENFLNKVFFAKELVPSPESNVLKLKHVTHGPLKKNGTKVFPAFGGPDEGGTVLANGVPDLPVKFRPLIEVSVLSEQRDHIFASRRIPENIFVRVTENGDSPGNPQVTFRLAYSEVESKDNCEIGGGDPLSITADVCTFIFKFYVKDDPNPTIADPEKVFKSDDSGDGSYANLKDGVDLPTIAILPSYDALDIENKLFVSPPANAAAPSLYSIVQYEVGDKLVKYYSNKLPRVPGSRVANPAVVVHGAIQTQASANVQADKDVVTSGRVNVNIVRDTIHANLQAVRPASLPDLSNCTITKLEDGDDGVNVVAKNDDGEECAPGVSKMGDENVLYFRGDDKNGVTINLGGEWTGRWVIITDGGNIFINKDVHVKDPVANRISFIALRENPRSDVTGNFYIASIVKNIQATIAVDGTIYSYNGSRGSIDEEDGMPDFGDSFSRINELSKQLLIEGAIFSCNTIGGADIDSGEKPRKYLLWCGGQSADTATEDDRERAQAHDLNYLRTFRLILNTDPNGRPIDQSCKMALSPEDILQIERRKTDATILPVENAGVKCDGINSVQRYVVDNSLADPNASTDGDLIPPPGTQIAQGLKAGSDFDPVYVFYRAPAEDSFIFSKKGTLDIR